jgi:hypothetical protein
MRPQFGIHSMYQYPYYAKFSRATITTIDIPDEEGTHVQAINKTIGCVRGNMSIFLHQNRALFAHVNTPILTSAWQKSQKHNNKINADIYPILGTDIESTDDYQKFVSQQCEICKEKEQENCNNTIYYSYVAYNLYILPFHIFHSYIRSRNTRSLSSCMETFGFLVSGHRR